MRINFSNRNCLSSMGQKQNWNGINQCHAMEKYYYWMLQIVQFQSFGQNAMPLRATNTWMSRFFALDGRRGRKCVERSGAMWCVCAVCACVCIECMHFALVDAEQRLNKLRRFKVFKPVDPVCVQLCAWLHVHVCEYVCVCVSGSMEWKKWETTSAIKWPPASKRQWNVF